MFQASPPRLFDIIVDTGGSKIEIRVNNSDVVLDLRSRRIHIDELDEMVQSDWERWTRFQKRRAKNSPWFRTHIEVYDPKNLSFPSGQIIGGQADWLSPTQALPTEAHNEELRASTLCGVKDYANSYLKDSEGYIYILNLQRLTTHLSGTKWVVENGFANVIPGVTVGWGFGCLIAREAVSLP
jgi:hypothetical protein